MSTTFIPCPRCARHVSAREDACPFCGNDVVGGAGAAGASPFRDDPPSPVPVPAYGMPRMRGVDERYARGRLGLQRAVVVLLVAGFLGIGWWLTRGAPLHPHG